MNQARIRVTRRAAPKTGVGGPTEVVYWYDRPMSAEDMLIEICGMNHQLELIREFGHTLASRNDPNNPPRMEVSWPSGQFLIALDLPKHHYREMVKAYLDKYPPSWDGQVDYDPTRITLKVLSETIPELIAHLDDPLEYLRYSYRYYPFDRACHRSWRILPINDYHRLHNDAARAINEKWSKTPADQIKLSDYRAAMLVHRREVLATIMAARERIAKQGIVHKGKLRLRSYGDADP